MPAYTVREPELIAGKKYKPGDEVPMDRIPTERRELLIRTRKLVPVSVRVPPPKER